MPLPEEELQKGNVKEVGVLEDFHTRIFPVLGEEIVRTLRFGPFLTRYTKSVVIDIWLARCDICSLRARGETDCQPVTCQAPQKAVRKDES